MGSNRLFWDSQWISHGTCSYHMFNQPRYFWLAHNIWARFNLFDLLVQAGIVPVDAEQTPSTIYRREDVLFAINVYHNVLLEVEIDCIEGTIEVCLDHSGTDYINCPGIGSCGWSFKWLKYSAKKKKQQPICEYSTTTEPKISNISQVHDRFGNNKFGIFLM